jgi:broad specificity phosphatase PhoE
MNINLYLLRHGQSVANLDHTEYMRTDDSLIALTPVGKKQCVLVAKDLNWRLKDNDQTVVLCSSPYARAISSAEIIQSHLNFNADIHIVDTLKERKLGSLVSEIDWSVTLTPKEIECVIPIPPTKIVFDTTNGWYSFVIRGVEVARLKDNGDLDIAGEITENVTF